jgi:hypothetical protein
MRKWLISERLGANEIGCVSNYANNLAVVLYACEILSLTLREDQTEGVWEQGAVEDIRIKDGWSDGRVEKTA